MKRRLISLLLALALSIGLVLPAYAETAATENTEVVHLDTCLENCALEDCACECHQAAEHTHDEQTHAEGCADDCAVEGCACECHVVTETPTEETVQHVTMCGGENCLITDCSCQCHAEPEVTEELTEAPSEEATEAPSEEPTEAPSEEPTDETVPHIEGCADDCAVEGCVCECHKDIVETEPVFDVNAVIAHLSACTTQEEKNAILDQLTDDELLELYNAAPELFIYVSDDQPAKNITNPGKFLAPVEFPALFRMMALAASEDSALQLNKTSVIKSGTTDTYTISLEAYTTGSVTVNQVSTACDIVLVLDESGSMTSDIGQNPVYELDTSKTYYVLSNDNAVSVTYSTRYNAWTSGYTTYVPKTSASDTTRNRVQFYEGYKTREAAIVDAVNAFLTSLRADNANLPEGVTGHRVGMIGFSTVNNTRIIRSLATTSTDPISTNTLNTSGGTYVHTGLGLVDDVFNGADATPGEERNRVVILFTDGEPGSGDWSNSNAAGTNNGDFGVAAEAINVAKILKADVDDNGYGATVYTVGIFAGADPSDTTSNGNKYMNAVSSNYKTASATSARSTLTVTWGDRATGNYYLSASDSNSLTAIFTAIAQQTAKPGVSLDSSTQVIDTVTPYFTIPENAAAIKLQLADYDGTTFGTPYDAPSTITASVISETSQVKVTGFDFNKNFIASSGRDENDSSKSGTFYGRKLIISFDVVAKDGFWGGNNVPTNVSDSSGLYLVDENGNLEMVENGSFGVSPEVNVPLNVPEFDAFDKNIYLLGDAPTAADLCDFVLPTGDDAWKIAYVDVTGPSADKTISNTSDTTDITISVTATPKYDGTDASGTPVSEAGDTKNATANVYVYKPVITFQDTGINVGETADYDDNFVSVEWKHGESVADTTAMGEAPALTYTYDIPAGAFTADTKVSVTVNMGETDVTNYVTFEHEDCTVENITCTWIPAEDEGVAGAEFIVHIKSFDLTITKTGANETLDPGQTFIFYITGPNGFSKTVIIEGNGSVTIAGLPVGTYTIEEDTSWSWRYTCTNAEQTVTAANVNNGAAEVTFVNDRTDDQWLDGNTIAENIFDVLQN